MISTCLVLFTSIPLLCVSNWEGANAPLTGSISNNKILLTLNNKEVGLFRLVDGVLKLDERIEFEDALACCFSHNSNDFAICNANTLVLYRTKKGSNERTATAVRVKHLIPIILMSNSTGLYAIGQFGVILRINPSNGDVSIVIDIQGEISCACLGVDEHTLAIGTKKGELLVISLKEGKILVRQPAHTAKMTAIRYFDKETLVTAGRDKRVCFWGIQDSKQPPQLKRELLCPGDVLSLQAISKKHFVVGLLDGTLLAYSFLRNRPVASVRVCKSDVHTLLRGPSRFLIVLGNDQNVKVFLVIGAQKGPTP